MIRLITIHAMVWMRSLRCVAKARSAGCCVTTAQPLSRGASAASNSVPPTLRVRKLRLGTPADQPGSATASLRAAADPQMSPHAAFPAAGHDRWVAVACRDDADWGALLDVSGRADLAAERVAAP